jgi:hypothetical protein
MSDHLPVVAELNFGDYSFASESTEQNFQSIVQNPVTDMLTVRLRTDKPRDVTIDIYSTLGVQMRSYQTNVFDDEVVEYNISELTNGMYIVNIKSEGVSVSHRIVKVE